MRVIFSYSFLFIVIYKLHFCFAQLPLQIEPKIRGFPGKRNNNNDGPISGRHSEEAMYRLNDTFTPSHYEVEVRVILDKDESVGEQFTAPGKVRIYGVNQKRTSRIVLHANLLEVNETSVSVMSRTTPKVKSDVIKLSYDVPRDFLMIDLGHEISAGEEIEIYIEFLAKMLVDEKGLFYRTYTTDKGETKYVATTQFQAVDARRMFPCFDEPGLKATFDLTVIRQNNYSSLANTELVHSKPDPEFPGWTIDKYARTVKMSPYLLALTVSDYSYTEAFFGNKPARSYGPRHLMKIGAGNYSATTAAKCLSFCESLLKVPYPMAKMDSVAIPGYGGAMENWGMNVYGFSYLFYLPERDTEARRSLVTLIFAHELSHQFGNLVTAKWWNEIFLNEGLSTYLQYLGMEYANPEFKGTEFFILDSFQFSMLYDAGQSTHPLTMNVSTPDEIDGMFSTISYEKGASIFRMMEGILTKETMLRGLQNYLETHAYKGVVQDDLYDSLQLAASKDNRLPSDLTVHDIMHTWTDQSGFPLVKVEIHNQNHVTLSQQRFANANDGSSEKDGLWYVPITVVTRSKPQLKNNVPQFWLENDGKPLTIPHNWESNEWIMINQNATGFYRVLYDDPLRHLIQEQLESDATIISPLSRSQLLDDYFVFGEEKYVNIQATLNFTRYLHKETHFTVWSTFFDHFSGIYEKFSSHPAYSLLRAYLQPKLDKALLSVGLEESPINTGAVAILRADLLDWSCSLESPLCKEYAGMLFAQWEANPSVNPITSLDSQKTLQCAMVASGGKREFDFMFEQYRKAGNNSRIRSDFLNALSCTTDEVLLDELLYKTLNSSTGLLPEDRASILNKVALSPFGRLFILSFISNNLDQIIETVGNGQLKPIGDVLTTLATYFTTEGQLEQVRNFMGEHGNKLDTVSASVQGAMGLIKENILWMENTGSDVWAWLWQQAQHKNKI